MTHQSIATIDRPDAAAVAAAALPACAGLADLVEVRLDSLWPQPPSEDAAVDALVTLLDAAEHAGLRLLATLRPTRQGGRFDGPEEVRINLLVAAARAGFAAIDLEDDQPAAGSIRRAIEAEGAVVVLSDHRFTAPPDRETGLRHLQSMQDLHGHLHKLAFPADDLIGLLRALELTHAHNHRTGRPVVLPYGAATPPADAAAHRALLSVAGNHATYGHAPDAPPAVPGQPSLAAIRATLDHWGLGPDELGARGDGSPWLAVLGDPVAHSLSPRLHNAALRTAGRPERFGALRIPADRGAMRLLVSVASRIGFTGASVTTPLKEHAAAVTRGDDAVKAIGAANCIRVRGTLVESTNTDATAAARILADRLPAAAHVAILGAGPAARAIAHGASAAGHRVSIVARRPDVDVPGADRVAWDDRADLRPDAWIQATTLGMDPNDEPALPAQAFADARLAVELVYANGPTPFQGAAVDADVPLVDGRTFLLEQAVDAYHYWTGAAPDRAAMEAALP